MNNLTYIALSPVHGQGVFASQDIPKGSKIADYYGEEMDWKTFKIRYGEYKNNSQYTYPMRRIWRIIVAKDEPYRSNNLTNFINENKVERNCQLRLRALYTTQDIIKDSELFLEYPADYHRHWEKVSL